MKNQIKKFGFVIIVALCFLFFFNYCNQNNNNKPTELPDAKNLTKILAGHKETFKSQWEEVKRNYPLVALAFTMQEAIIYEQMDSGTLASNLVSDYYFALTERSILSKEEIVRRNLCFRNLERELARSQNYQEGQAAFDKFQNCIHRRN